MIMRTISAGFPNNLGELCVQFHCTSILPEARNKLAKFAVEENFTHLLFIDSDMEFPGDLILRMLPREEPIIAANCTSRKPPYRNTAQSAPGVEVATGSESTGLEKVMRAGTGVMWVATDVFRAMPKPWFAFQYVEEADCFRGEDYRFCEQAAEAGFAVHIDHDLSKLVKHIGNFGYGPLLREAADLRERERAA
jgi:hypothetical protein